MYQLEAALRHSAAPSVKSARALWKDASSDIDNLWAATTRILHQVVIALECKKIDLMDDSDIKILEEGRTAL